MSPESGAPNVASNSVHGIGVVMGSVVTGSCGNEYRVLLQIKLFSVCIFYVWSCEFDVAGSLGVRCDISLKGLDGDIAPKRRHGEV